jgi:uncharacterized protein (DUF58 family)
MSVTGSMAGLAFTLAALAPAPPREVVLLVDVSHSVTHPGVIKTDRALVADAAAAAAGALGASDRMHLGTFGQSIRITSAIASEPAAIMQAAAELSDVGGPSPIWDALGAAADALAPATGRRLVIVITDGKSTGNRVGFQDIAARLERDRISVLIIALDLARRPGPDPAVRLRALAERTGGTYVLVKRNGVRAAVGRALSAAGGL